MVIITDDKCTDKELYFSKYGQSTIRATIPLTIDAPSSIEIPHKYIGPVGKMEYDKEKMIVTITYAFSANIGSAQREYKIVASKSK